MKTKNLIISMMLFLLTSTIGICDDNFYSVYDNVIISNNYKIILDDVLESNILIDNNNLYYYTLNNFYISNKTNGNILYKLSISSIKNQEQTDNYSYLQTDYNIYKINKSSGIIEEKEYILNYLKKYIHFLEFLD